VLRAQQRSAVRRKEERQGEGQQRHNTAMPAERSTTVFHYNGRWAYSNCAQQGLYVVELVEELSEERRRTPTHARES
jgi:hypothetical protein